MGAVLCQELEPDHGDCGYTLVMPRDYELYMPQEYELAQRYPAMVVNSSVYIAACQYENSIRSVQWLTFRLTVILNASVVRLMSAKYYLLIRKLP